MVNSLSSTSKQADDESHPKKRFRTRTGCLNCRKKKRKCDERRPTCGGCGRRSQVCEWGVKLKFREENAHRISRDHPSMRRVARRGPRKYEIRDITADVIRDYNVSSPPALDFDDESPTAGGESSTLASIDAGTTGSHIASQANGFTPFNTTTDSESFAPIGFTPSAVSFSDADSPLLTTHSSPVAARRQTDSAVADLIYFSQGGQAPPTRDSAMRMSLNSMPLGLMPGYLNSGPSFAQDVSSVEDGIFLPGSAYHELHSTLRHHLIQEVRSNVSTRPATPRLDADIPDREVLIGSHVPEKLVESAGESSGADGDRPLLDKDEECDLWRNWVDEIAPWLDKFDNDRHFQYTLPTLAPTNDHLRYAILALSARQLELKETTQPTDRSLALYQEAIHLLLPNLASRSTAVIASCVILCVLEMLSCSPKAWQRHLDGCASLMEAVGINGFVGGVEQALFWCFARMDVCGGLISSVTTLIPVSHWASKMDLDADAQLFHTVDNFSSWANYAIYLTAQVLNLLVPLSDVTTVKVRNRADAKFRSRWLKLWNYICRWLDDRPPPLLPIMVVPASDSSPFSKIIFSNPAAISGNQMYHTASLLMLQNQPPDVKLPQKPKSILWHARRICAISISNDHHGAWTNAVQPLWVAGRCMSNPAEHRAILDILERIEKESGWSTKWRQDDLKAFWGDLED